MNAPMAIIGVDSFGYMEAFDEDIVATKARALTDGYVYISNTRGLFRIGIDNGAEWQLYTLATRQYVST